MSRLAIYAWVGEDEFGSGRVGIKQGITAAGCIPLAAMDYDLHKLTRMVPLMEEQAKRYGKKIRLCKFEMIEVAAETKAGADPMSDPRPDSDRKSAITCEISQDSFGKPWIKCLRCGLGSYNPHDIEKKYCGYCHIFHPCEMHEENLK